MGKRLGKNDLLAEIQQERIKLDGLLEPLRPRQMTSARVTLAGWSVKDLLGHLISWQEMNLGWYAGGVAGQTVEVPAAGLSWKDVGAINERIYRHHRRRSLKDVLKDYGDSHQAMLNAIDECSEEMLVELQYFEWTGASWALSDYFRANTASHYRWASKHIRKWQRQQRSP